MQACALVKYCRSTASGLDFMLAWLHECEQYHKLSISTKRTVLVLLVVGENLFENREDSGCVFCPGGCLPLTDYVPDGFLPSCYRGFAFLLPEPDFFSLDFFGEQLGRVTVVALCSVFLILCPSVYLTGFRAQS